VASAARSVWLPRWHPARRGVLPCVGNEERDRRLLGVAIFVAKVRVCTAPDDQVARQRDTGHEQGDTRNQGDREHSRSDRRASASSQGDPLPAVRFPSGCLTYRGPRGFITPGLHKPDQPHCGRNFVIEQRGRPRPRCTLSSGWEAVNSLGQIAQQTWWRSHTSRFRGEIR